MPTMVLFCFFWPSFLAPSTSFFLSSSARAGSGSDNRVELAASPNKARRRVMSTRPVRSIDDIALLRGLLIRCRPADRGLELLTICLEPVDLYVGLERTGASLPEHLRVVDTRLNIALLCEITCGRQKTPPCSRDHDVTRSKMFLCVINDRSHALRNGLVLHHDVANTGIDPVSTLCFPIDLPVVGRVLDRPPATEPIRRIGPIFQ